MQALAGERWSPGQLLTEPLDNVSSKSRRWVQLRHCQVEPVQPQWWDELARLAGEQGREPIETEHAREGMSCFRASIGMGVDKVNPRWWRDLPHGGLEDPCELFNVIGARQSAGPR